MKAFDMKRDLASMLLELEQSADIAKEQIDRAAEEGRQALEAAAAFWKAPPQITPDYLRAADHVLTLRIHLPKSQRAQLGINVWGTGPVADLYDTTEGDYDVLLILRRKTS